MSVHISLESNRLIIEDPNKCLSGKYYSQLNFFGFKTNSQTDKHIYSGISDDGVLEKIISYFLNNEIPYHLSDEIRQIKEHTENQQSILQTALHSGYNLKNGNLNSSEYTEFLEFSAIELKRKLKSHQIKATLHLLTVENGANFSVPGSGKTTVALAAYAWLKKRGIVDALFVVGPPACFRPWYSEYSEVLGVDPKTVYLAGGSIDNRHASYVASPKYRNDLYLTTFQTLYRDSSHVQQLFKDSGIRFFLIVDEAHYIKQLDGVWATAVLNVCQYAARRCVLTGTPFPRAYSDIYNIFDVLWPQSSPLPQSDRIKIESLSDRKNNTQVVDILNKSIGPLFYRVRKADLGLAPQKFHDPIVIPMAKYERIIYDAILNRLRDLSKKDVLLHNWDLLTRLRQGRMMRLRQTLSYSKLLKSAIKEYNEDLVDAELSLSKIIQNYDSLEIPGKLSLLTEIVTKLRSKGEKVLIWSNFVQTLKLISNHLKKIKDNVELIYGEVPTERDSSNDVQSREQIIEKFLDTNSGIDILIANPAACSESISLHKSCSNAIYYDLSYNCAQYLQSLDRIHRVGGSENKISNYYFLQYENTIDSDILDNLQRKAHRMNSVIDHDYPIYNLDMFSTDEELDAYGRIFL